MYIIADGEVSITQKKAGEENARDVEIGRSKIGQYFGERALLKNEPRAGTVTA